VTIVSLLARCSMGCRWCTPPLPAPRHQADNIYVRDEDGSLVLLDFGAARQTAIEKARSAPW